MNLSNRKNIDLPILRYLQSTRIIIFEMLQSSGFEKGQRAGILIFLYIFITTPEGQARVQLAKAED